MFWPGLDTTLGATVVLQGHGPRYKQGGFMQEDEQGINTAVGSSSERFTADQIN